MSDVAQNPRGRRLNVSVAKMAATQSPFKRFAHRLDRCKVVASTPSTRTGRATPRPRAIQFLAPHREGRREASRIEAQLVPCVVAMEACSSAHHWGGNCRRSASESRSSRPRSEGLRAPEQDRRQPMRRRSAKRPGRMTRSAKFCPEADVPDFCCFFLSIWAEGVAIPLIAGRLLVVRPVRSRRGSSPPGTGTSTPGPGHPFLRASPAPARPPPARSDPCRLLALEGGGGLGRSRGTPGPGGRGATPRGYGRRQVVPPTPR